ncbi:B12-binding domain-containing radical SAM protein [candidate division KSB1 bacterium]
MILINPGYDRMRKLGAFSKYVPISVPLGIGYLAGYLVKNDKTVKILDDGIIPVTDELLDEYVKEIEKPYIFGVSCLTASIARGHKIAEILKKKFPDCIIIFGGIHPTVLPGETLENPNIDIVVKSEGEEILNELYSKLKNNEDFSDVKGISFRKGGEIIHNERAPLPDLNKMSSFPHYLFEKNIDKYEFGFIASSRGCPYDCTFCSQRVISGKRFRYFPKEIVIEELDRLINKYNRTYITFMDDSFAINKKRVLELCDLIYEKGFHKKAAFDCQMRGDKITEDLLVSLKRANFRTLYIGVETGSERLMKIINKGETVQQIIDGVKLAKKWGFSVPSAFLIGLPTETKEERNAAYKLAKKMKLDYVRFNNATPYPGTKLYEIAKSENRLNPGENWENLNACGTLADSSFKEHPLSYIPLTTSEIELKRDILKFNLFYSFRPQSIFKILKDKVGPAGWLTLPKRWYFSLEDWIYFTRVAFKVFLSFLRIFIYSVQIYFNDKFRSKH